MVFAGQPEWTKTMTLGLLEKPEGQGLQVTYFWSYHVEKFNMVYWGIFNITYEISFENNIFNY